MLSNSVSTRGNTSKLDDSFDLTNDTFLLQGSSAPPFLTRKITRDANLKSVITSKHTNGDDTDDFNEIQDMLDQWSTPQMETYLGEVEKDVETYHARKKQQEDEEVSKLEAKLSNLWSERQERLQKHLQVIKDREDAERRRLEELERQRKMKEEEERQRKIKEEEERIRLEKEKAEAEARRKAEEEAERKRQEEERKRQEEEKAAAEKAAAEKAAAEAEEARKKAEEEAKQEAERKKTSAAAFTSWRDVDKEFLQHKQTITDIKANILAPVTNTKELKSFCFQTKRKIKPKLGQLTDSQTQLVKLYNEIAAIIEECKAANELVFLWILNFFSKSVVAQAETETIVSIQSALPLGKLAVMLMLRFEPLYKLLLARFVKKCPFVIGYSCAIDTEEGRLRMGWKRSGEKWEDPSAYAERLSGICAVWAVMTISQVETNGQPHPYPIANSWRFLARMANTNAEILSNAHYSVVANWWDVASATFAKAYGKQGRKLLQVIYGPWTQQVMDKRYPSAMRLELLGEDWQTSSQLKSLKPMER